MEVTWVNSSKPGDAYMQQQTKAGLIQVMKPEKK